MKGLIKNWKVTGIIAFGVFCIGIGCLFYFKNSTKEFSKIDEFSYENVGINVEQKNENDTNINENKSKSNEEIYIHIIGEVKNQGVITLSKGQRIVDAIEKAGGATDSADLSKVNLAYGLSDGQKVRIPSVNENMVYNEEYVTNGGGEGIITGAGGSYARKININTASQTELETISGVGPSLAAKIINYREKNGKFNNIDELKNVSGIGDAKFEGLKDFIDV